MSAEEPLDVSRSPGDLDHSEKDGFRDQEKAGIVTLEKETSWFSSPRNRKFLWYGFIVFVLMLLTPGAYHGLKGWRARGFIEKSWGAFARGDLPQGISLLRQAEALAPGTPAVEHAAAIYNARAGDMNSLQLLLAQMRSGSLTSGELLGVAEIEAEAGRRKEAVEALSYLPKNLDSQESLRRTLTESMILADEGNIFQASSMCLSKAGFMGKAESGFLRIQAARYLLALQSPSSSRDASELLRSVAREQTEASITAWRMEANRVLASTQESATEASRQEVHELLNMLPLLSDHLLYDQLLAAEMEIRIDPARKESVLKKLTDSYQNSDRSVMLELARWLNSRGYRSEVIAFAGGVRPLNDTDWLLVVLDAKSAQGRWDEVSAMLDSPASAGIPDAVRDLFLARIASMRGDQKAADEAWSSVTASLYLEKPETLAYIAGYEEQIGAMDQAARTYRELANRDSTRKIGLTALIRIQSPTTPAKTLIPLYEELLAEAPDYADAAGDLDYLKLLVGEEIPQAAGDAEKLFESQPNSLARISTAALGRLKQGDVKGALSLYEGKSIDWGGAPAPWRVVRSAVLRAAGDIPGAEKMAASIDSGVLRPEEAALLGKR